MQKPISSLNKNCFNPKNWQNHQIRYFTSLSHTSISYFSPSQSTEHIIYWFFSLVCHGNYICTNTFYFLWAANIFESTKLNCVNNPKGRNKISRWIYVSVVASKQASRELERTTMCPMGFYFNLIENHNPVLLGFVVKIARHFLVV